jgi:hypothetical protein
MAHIDPSAFLELGLDVNTGLVTTVVPAAPMHAAPRARP